MDAGSTELGGKRAANGAAQERPRRREVTESSQAYELSNVVETALVKALVLAAEAKRWDVVVLIAEELRRRHTTSVDGLLLRQHFR
jgi:hypothetical protein